MAYATVADVALRLRRALDEAEEALAEELLEQASAMLDALVDVDPDDATQATLLRGTCAAMVTRALVAAGNDAYGVSQLDYGMGPFSQTAHFSNPNGDLYLTSQERSLLGVGRGLVGSLRALVDGAYGSNAVSADA